MRYLASILLAVFISAAAATAQGNAISDIPRISARIAYNLDSAKANKIVV